MHAQKGFSRPRMEENLGQKKQRSGDIVEDMELKIMKSVPTMA